MNKMNKYYIFTLLILLILVQILVLIEFNTDYKLINNIPKIIKSNIGTLFIGTHNYEHKDIFITMKHFEKHNNKFYMLFANKYWNHLLEPFRPKNIEFLYVKENTVQKLTSKLLLGNNVIMFLYLESESSGPYYILQNTKSPLIILKINKLNGNNSNNNTKQINTAKNHYNSSFKDIYWDNLHAKFILEFKVKYYLTKNTPPKTFIKQLKHKMYH